MKSDSYLFSQRLTRRDFLASSAGATAALALPTLTPAAETRTPVRLGSGYHTYELVEGWGQLPSGMSYGFGCGVVIDAQDRVYVTSRSANPCVAIFARDGTLLETWSNNLAEKVGQNTAQVEDTAQRPKKSQERPEDFKQ